MPDMSEASIYEALGVTPQSEGGKEQAPAEPAAAEPTTPTEEGGKAQEVAAPASDGGTKAGNDPSPGAGAPPSPQGEGQNGDGLSDAQRRENAARRRREEQQQAVNDALAQERKRELSRWDAFFAKANLKNTLTGKAITNLQEFDEWHEEFQTKRLEQDLKAGKLTPEGLEQIVRKVTQSSPSPAPAGAPSPAGGGKGTGASPDGPPRALAPTEGGPSGTPAPTSAAPSGPSGASAPTGGGKGTEAQISAPDMQAAKARMDAQIAEIHKIDPTINSMADLIRMPKAREFYEKVRAGNTFLDAWYLTHREELEAKTAETARQQTMNAARSKDHLSGGAKRVGTGSIEVPADVLEQYRFLNPGISDAEIREHYNKNHKR